MLDGEGEKMHVCDCNFLIDLPMRTQLPADIFSVCL